MRFKEEQYELDFCELMQQQFGYIKDVRYLILSLLRVGIIHQKTALEVMSLHRYSKTLKSTRSRKNKRGNKCLAIGLTCADMPISERKMHNLLKHRNIKYANSLFLP